MNELNFDDEMFLEDTENNFQPELEYGFEDDETQFDSDCDDEINKLLEGF